MANYHRQVRIDIIPETLYIDKAPRRGHGIVRTRESALIHMKEYRTLELARTQCAQGSPAARSPQTRRDVLAPRAQQLTRGRFSRSCVATCPCRFVGSWFVLRPAVSPVALNTGNIHSQTRRTYFERYS